MLLPVPSFRFTRLVATVVAVASIGSVSFAQAPVERRANTGDPLEILTGEPLRVPEPEPDEIETDRDSFTPATTLAPKRRLIVESAYSFIDNRGFKETHSFPELLLRYGLTDRIELRLGWNAEIGGTPSEVSGSAVAEEEAPLSGSNIIREYSLSYGIKVRATDQDRWIPRSVFIVQGYTPTGGASNDSQIVATYAAGWTLPNRWQFDSAIRYGTQKEESDHYNVWAPSTVLKIPVAEKWAAHAEYFGFFTSGKERNTSKHYVSPGLHYLVTPDFEVGFRLGWGLNDESSRFFANVGVGYRY
jgi:hypothetical protein